MRRILRSIIVSVCLLGGLGIAAPAANLSGDFTATLAGEPVSVESEASKFRFDLEGVLNLDLSLSGLSLANTTVLGIGGLQFQALKLETILGPLDLADTLVFAPNIIEFDDDLLHTVVFANPDPGMLVGLPLALFWDDPISQLDLARLLSPTLGGPLLFRKKIVELAARIGGFHPEVVLLLADLGSPQTPSLQVGGIFELSGKTAWGVELAAASYIGARQGGECFGACKPGERFYHGRVVPGLRFEEEKLSLTGLRLLGGEHALYVTLELSDGLPQLAELEVESRFAWRGLQVEHLARFATHRRGLAQEELALAWTREGLKLRLLLFDDSGAFSFPYKQLVTEFTVGKLELENLLLLSPAAGLADRLTASFGLGSDTRLVSITEVLGGGFYSQRLGLSRSWGGLELRGDVTFRAGFLLGGQVQLRAEF